ncbi:SDR family oxidoreductase [Actinospongicola halichondriae]|uniref:SDR family oxidoreductase n=1 Tax=Actinospongicola halichondriae TaxID=3236844 RepID=UPI003D3A594D
MHTILVTGATGYIGGRLVPALLEAGHQVRCLVRTPSKLEGIPWATDVTVIEGDIGDAHSVREAMDGCDAAYFLVHSMGGDDDFAAQDRDHAAVFAAAAGDTPTMEQIVYLGGLGDDEDDLSPHLSSRHEVGRILASGRVPVTELRAAVIIGSGSASFEMLRNLVEVLPVMVTPRWVDTRVQPIGIRDILHALTVVLDRDDARDRVIEVGGPDVLTYREMMHTYAEVAGLRRRLIVPVPVLSPSLSSHWVGFVTPLPQDLAAPLVESLVNEVIVQDETLDLFEGSPRVSFRASVELALRRVEDLAVNTRWSDAALPGATAADPLPSDPDWSGGTILTDEQTAAADDVSPAQVFTALAGIGGARGWFVADILWTIRGVADQLVGGPGMRRGRRDPDRLRVGDALDSWRVEATDPPSLLRLRAEMRLPGEAWLEWRIEPHGSGAALTQRAVFAPRGLFGRVYWYVMAPFHRLIFARLAREIVERGRATPLGSAS